MFKHYLVLATKVLLRRKFFTFISLFGISFTLLVLMVATAMLDHALAPQAPETRQHRTLGVHHAIMFGPNGSWNGNAGFKVFDRYARNLPGVERLSVFSRGGLVTSYVGGQKIQSSLKRTDGEFWKILEFTFIEGDPYNTQDVEDARFVAVINRTTREKFFADRPAVGQAFEADGQRFRVVGVVENVSEFRFVPFADLWVPYTTAKSDGYKNEVMGNFEAIALGTSRSVLPGIREEFNARLERIELPDPTYRTLVAPFETKFDGLARNLLPRAAEKSTERQGTTLIAIFTGVTLIFVLLPTVNLVNLNVSRIMERASEIGVRKAFGASSWTLVGQFIVENVVLSIVGGLAGLALSVLFLDAFNKSGMVRYAQLGVNYRVFAYGMALAVVFGFISGVYPAWRMSRLNPVDALKGGGTR